MDFRVQLLCFELIWVAQLERTIVITLPALVFLSLSPAAEHGIEEKQGPSLVSKCLIKVPILTSESEYVVEVL